MAAAGAVVTMTDTARDRLLVGYAVDPAQGLGHPARRRRATPARPSTGATRPHLLTWGLLGPGKGIEWALRALARLQDLRPDADLHGGRPDPPEGARAARRGVPGRLHQLGAELGVAHAVRLRGRLPRPGGAGPADPLRRRGGAAVRLHRAGHLRRAHRGGGRRRARWSPPRSRTPSSCSPTGPACSCRTRTRRRWPRRSGRSSPSPAWPPRLAGRSGRPDAALAGGGGPLPGARRRRSSPPARPPSAAVPA